MIDEKKFIIWAVTKYNDMEYIVTHFKDIIAEYEKEGDSDDRQEVNNCKKD